MESAEPIILKFIKNVIAPFDLYYFVRYPTDWSNQDAERGLQWMESSGTYFAYSYF